MRFSVSSTSGRADILNIVKETYQYLDQRNTATAEGLKSMSIDEWYSTGTNHGVNDIGIYRYLNRQLVNEEVEIKDLKTLLAFVEQHGVIIIRSSEIYLVNGPEFEIEVYDDYRE